jgi:hypothetical protein
LCKKIESVESTLKGILKISVEVLFDLFMNVGKQLRFCLEAAEFSLFAFARKSCQGLATVRGT